MDATLRFVLRTLLGLTSAAVIALAFPFISRESLAQNPTASSPQSRTVRLNGEILRGQTWEREVRPGLFFRLVPAGLGWTISPGSRNGSDHNFAAVVTPPYRGINHLYIEGWHFRNSDNSGPNEAGPKNVNAPQEVREFEFVRNDADYQPAFDALQKMLWSYSYSPGDIAAAEQLHERLRKGKGVLTIQEMRLNNLEPGKQAGIDWMKFEIELVFPPDF